VKKGGKMEDTIGRQCLCNALLSVIGHPQTRANGTVESPIVTSGDDLATIGGFLGGRTSYTAADVVAYLLSCRCEAQCVSVRPNTGLKLTGSPDTIGVGDPAAGATGRPAA
jgi:hypothetical protein